jgi:hypothetical protein
MGKFVDIYDHPKFHQQTINHLSISITNKEIEVVIKNLSKKKSPGPERFTAEFYHKIEREGRLLNSF